ncbi:MAG: hypothetical protein RL685_3360 [Pseudomonadota bacterium]|jgi:hypothetical protein
MLFTMLGLLLASAPCAADEGMWPFNHLPRDAWRERYGFEPSEPWLEHVRRASVRVSTCSGSFVSGSGLVLTNQHCAIDCLARISSPGRDRVKDGFYARSMREEPSCPGFAVQQLEQISDVSERVRQATRGLEGAAFEQALTAETARLEAECTTDATTLCEVVSLYQGGRHELYRYRLYEDVRLVFAPEHAVAQFGGDPDNFDFPRFAFDVTFLRAYEHGQPATTPDYLRWSGASLAVNDLLFVSGSPGSTERQRTVAELAFLRDRALVAELTELAGYRGFLQEYQQRGAEAARHIAPELLRVENLFKELRGARQALLEPRFFRSLVARERELRGRVQAHAEWRQRYGGAWEAIERLTQQLELGHEWLWIEGPAGFRPPWAKGKLMLWARWLVRAASERTKPNAQRLEEYGDARLPALEQRLLAEQPLDRPLEQRQLELGLRSLREALGVEHPFVRDVLGKASPAERARVLVQGSQLHQLTERRRLWQGGQAAVSASRDPLLQLAQAIDARGRALRARYEAEIESIALHSSERIAQARFAAYGTSSYPDATGSPRLSYGTVRGWREPRTGKWVPAFTTLAGLFARATGRAPYELPPSWLRHECSLRLETPLNFVLDADVVGGNSGSPLIDRQGELVGLLFDGNLHSLAGSYGFDIALNRAIALDTRFIIHALDVVYGAQRLTAELGTARAAPPSPVRKP